MTEDIGNQQSSTHEKLMQVFYVSEARGADLIDPKRGTQATAPFATASFALERDPQSKLMIEKNGEFRDITPSALKKARKQLENNLRKREKAEKKAQAQKEATNEESIALAERLEKAKLVSVVEDSSLPPAQKIKIRDADRFHDKRVHVSGWVHRLRVQKGTVFIVLRDGTGLLQAVVLGEYAGSYDMLTLTLESTIELYGVLQELPPGKTAPGNHELAVDYFKVVQFAPSGEETFSNKVSADADPSYQYDMRHLMIRGDTLSSVLKVRSVALNAFRKVYCEMGFVEVTPPCMVQTQCEGGATLFDFKYYGQKAYLTQSSQLYLETCLPALGDVFCVQESFRAEKAHTRRHLSEYTHVEAELAFISFEDMLQHLEDYICRVVDFILSDETAAPLIKILNPSFRAPERPFMRLDYCDAIKYLQEHDIRDKDGNVHQIGDDIAEAAERTMTDQIGRPIFLTGFPLHIKSFYMKRMAERPDFTEAVDMLIPTVGEMVGGSMRIDDYDELLAAYEREGIDPTPYYWFTDQRKYGSCPHGGYGIGLERFLAWMLGRYTVRDCCLYPRFTDRCTP